MNDLSTHQNTSLAAAPARNAFEAYAEAVNRNRIVGELLKFNKGDWLAGQNNDELDAGTRMIAAMDELMIGWLKWEDGKPTDMKMGRVIEGFVPPSRKELGDTDEADWDVDDDGKPKDPWTLTNYLILKEEDGDQLYTFAPSSKGGIGCIGKLSGIYGKAMRQKPDQFPIVELRFDAYNHPNKAYGRIKTPVLEVVGWAPKAPTLAAIVGEAEDAAAENKAAAELDDEDGVKSNARGDAPGAATRF